MNASSALAREGFDEDEPTGRRFSVVLGVSVALLLFAALFLIGRMAAARDPLRLAWRSAKAHGNYAFEGESAARIGERLSRQQMRGYGTLEGAIDLYLLGSPGSGSRYRIAWPEAKVLSETGRPSEQPIDPHALALVLPLGDPLVLLAMGQAAQPGPLERVDERDCRRIDFRVGGRAYGAWWLEHRQFVPVNADSGGLHTFSAEASLWQDVETNLPCRIRAKTDLPRLGGAQPGSGEVDWVYSEWGVETWSHLGGQMIVSEGTLP